MLVLYFFSFSVFADTGYGVALILILHVYIVYVQQLTQGMQSSKGTDRGRYVPSENTDRVADLESRLAVAERKASDYEHVVDTLRQRGGGGPNGNGTAERVTGSHRMQVDELKAELQRKTKESDKEITRLKRQLLAAHSPPTSQCVLCLISHTLPFSLSSFSTVVAFFN